MRRTLRLAAVAIALFVALSVAAPTAAFAAPPPDFDPSTSKWRAYMLNITGRVLGSAMPDKWRAEAIANEFALRMSPDALAAATGIGRGNPLDQVPQTIEDYYAQEYERQTQRKVTATGTGPVRAPATPGSKLIKTVGGVAAAVTGLEIGTALGAGGVNLVGGWFGWDANGTVCSNIAGTPGEALSSWVTGQDCSAWKLANTYDPNSDAPVQWSSCNGSGVCIVGSRVASLSVSGGGGRWCYSLTGGTANYYDVWWQETPGGSLTTGGLYRTTTPNQYIGNCLSPEYYGGYWSATGQGWGKPHGVVQFRLPSGQLSGVTETESDPERSQTCTVHYTDGSTAAATGATYKESDGSVQPASCPATPEGKVPDSVTVTENGNGSPKELYSEPTTPEFQTWADEFGHCGDGTCFLDLVKVAPDSVVSCFDLTDGCPGWWEDPAKTENYRCVYGAEEVGLAECAIYSGLFQPGRVEVGAPYSDPMTGEWSGGLNSVKPDQQAMGQGIQNPSATYRSCNGMNVTGFDPVGFVMRPIQCALEWAFVPRPAVAAVSFAGVESVWETKPPGAISSAMADVEITGAATGCSISTTYKGVTTPIVDACGGWMAGLATFSRFAATAIMAWAVFAQVRRQIAAMVNYNVGQD